MPRGSVRKLDYPMLKIATYECLLELELDKEYTRKEFYEDCAVRYGKVSGHIIAQRGSTAVERVQVACAIVAKEQGWHFFQKSVVIPDAFDPLGNKLTKNVGYMRWHK